MAQAMLLQGHQVRLFVPTWRLGGENHLYQAEGIENISGSSAEDLARLYGLKVQFPLFYLQARPVWRRYDFSLAAVRAAVKWKAQVVYTRLPQAAALASLLGLPTILEAHDMPQGLAGPVLLRSFLSGRGARRLVCITSALAQDLQGRYGRNRISKLVVVAPDGVDIERFESLPGPEQARSIINVKTPDKFQRPLRRFTAGYTGHLYAGRGVQFMLDLAENLPEMDFLLAGGENRQISELNEMIASRKLENLFIAGFVPNAELPIYQAACDILLMPYQSQVAASSGGDISRYLSPMKLFEYLACGRVIVSSNLPVFYEILNDQNAVLLPAGEVKSWMKALRQLQGNPQMRQNLAEQARNEALNYTWEKRVERILQGIVPHE